MTPKEIANRICPVVGEGCLIPYGFSRSARGDVFMKLPMFSTWKAKRGFLFRDDTLAWGTLHLFFNSARGFKFFWVEHTEQPKIL